MSRLTRDGTAKPVSQNKILRHAWGQGITHFPCSADHEQDWQPYPVDPYSAICDDHTYHTFACRSLALAFSAEINFAMKRFSFCSAVLRHSPSSWAAVVQWLAFLAAHAAPPPTNSPNIMHFGSLVPSMRTTNPAKKIRVLSKVASML